jgi:hypothetical protein
MFLNQIDVYANKIEDWMKKQPMQSLTQSFEYGLQRYILESIMS